MTREKAEGLLVKMRAAFVLRDAIFRLSSSDMDLARKYNARGQALRNAIHAGGWRVVFKGGEFHLAEKETP